MKIAKKHCDLCGKEVNSWHYIIFNMDYDGIRHEVYYLCDSCYNSEIKEFNSKKVELENSLGIKQSGRKLANILLKIRNML